MTTFSSKGRLQRVIVQADAPFRADAQAITALKTRNAAGEMVPLGALMTVEPTFGPTRVTRYNGFPSADINGAPKPGYSSGEALAAINSASVSMEMGGRLYTVEIPEDGEYLLMHKTGSYIKFTNDGPKPQ